MTTPTESPDLINLMEWNRFAEDRKTLLEALTILNNRHRTIVDELNQRLIERQESFQTQLVRIESTWREKLCEAQAQIVALRDALGTLSKAAETCMDYCYSDGSVHHQTFDTKAIGTAILASRSTLSTPPPPVVPLEDVKPLVEALRAISKQKLSKELDTDEHQSADFEYGYDSCVEQSREALTTFTAKHPL